MSAPVVRRRVALLAVVLVAAISAVVAAQWRAPAPSTGTDAVRLGPVTGQRVEDYLVAASAELTDRVRHGADDPAYALVQLTAYQAPDDLAGLLGDDVQPVRAIVRVPIPRVQTAILQVPAVGLPADVATGMARAADELATQARRAGDDVSAAVARAQVDPLRAGCACVCAVIVSARPSQLALLADRDGVRGVQVAPAGRPLDRLAFVPLLPEQVDVVAPPPDDGAEDLATDAATDPARSTP